MSVEFPNIPQDYNVSMPLEIPADKEVQEKTIEFTPQEQLQKEQPEINEQQIKEINEFNNINGMDIENQVPDLNNLLQQYEAPKTTEVQAQAALEVKQQAEAQAALEAQVAALAQAALEAQQEAQRQAAAQAIAQQQAQAQINMQTTVDIIQDTAQAMPVADIQQTDALQSIMQQTLKGNSGSQVANFATQFVGNPYVYGGTSLTDGCDCSGFIVSVYNNFGISLPHNSNALVSVGSDVGGLENAQPGDVMIFPHHAAIYIGNGQIVHAESSDTGIVITNLAKRKKPPTAIRRLV